jgi:hypothetical protein
MAVYGDSSTDCKYGLIPYGGFKVQAGCITYLASTSFCAPTTFQSVKSLVVSSGDGSCSPTEVPCISNGFIAATILNTASAKVLNYVAFGF